MVSSKHQQTGFSLCLIRQRNVNSHLVTVKVGVVGSTNQWVQPHCLTRYQYRFKGLNTQTVQSRCPVKQNWVFTDNVFQDIEDLVVTLIDQAFSSLDVGSQAPLGQFMHDKWLEQFHCHWYWQPHLVHLQVRTNIDN